ncbi:hypothetical protein PCASD_24512 [Puccinia coronata f. sp. avenae]|uniref:Uncharacterized protein n=1 Tax=Puccinia coronata f. sp. avenae TaxID=200324 RepID=A0A2N5S8X5_9BASI|nr:hypothetical protein PCASD_24512 [Puccinia coronata f. sp. avenae]
MSTPPIRMEDELSVLSEQIPTPTPPPQLTKVELTCSLWFENPFTSPPAGSPLSLASEETQYTIADAAHPLRMELEEGAMTFGAFTNAIIVEIGSAAPAAYHLCQVLSEAADSRHIRWRYSITQHDGSQSWTAEARSGDKYDAFIAAAHAFPASSRFEVHVKMDKPEEEIVIVQGFRPPAITIVLDVLAPETQQPAIQAADEQPPENQVANHHAANNPVPDFTLEQFFAICKIDFHNSQIQALLKKHLIFHWSIFRGVGVRRLENLGFKFGASPLIVEGTLEAIRLTENNI